PLGRNHEFVDEKPPDKGSCFPDGYNNGWDLPSASDSACLLPERLGRGWPLGFRSQHSSCCSDCHSDALDDFAPGRDYFDISLLFFFIILILLI
ncbi:hypothetical protein AVEN_180777-1, partial [Araneus ventricosus]